MLQAELDEHLEYGHGDAPPLCLNTRNGTSKNNLKIPYGEIVIEIPRHIEQSL